MFCVTYLKIYHVWEVERWRRTELISHLEILFLRTAVSRLARLGSWETNSTPTRVSACLHPLTRETFHLWEGGREVVRGWGCKNIKSFNTSYLYRIWQVGRESCWQFWKALSLNYKFLALLLTCHNLWYFMKCFTSPDEEEHSSTFSFPEWMMEEMFLSSGSCWCRE